MDGDPLINQCNRVDLRKALCTACKKHIRVPCPKCEAQSTNALCWAYYHKILGYCHRHCSGLEKDPDPIIHQWNRDELRKTLCFVCKNHLRVQCPKCKGQNTNEPCWGYWHKTVGYLHRHCSDSQMEK